MGSSEKRRQKRRNQRNQRNQRKGGQVSPKEELTAPVREMLPTNFMTMGSINVDKEPIVSNEDIEKIDPEKVVICIPCEDMMHSAFSVSMFNMIQHTLLNIPPNLGSLAIQTFSSSILPWNRHSLVEGALQIGATRILWIDSDMMFPKDTLLHFLSIKESIVGINAMSRRPPYRCLAQVSHGVPMETNEHTTGLEKAYRFGMGMVWIETEIYKRVEKPWYNFHWVEEKNLYRGEDYFFFDKAVELGYDLYVDHDISKHVWHIGSFGFNPMLKTMKDKQDASETDISPEL